ncbi:glycosyl hydrolase family 28-related protein [Antarctobacter sp.]|uniref:glycosyl hydrolase family 28-related protein n=1 Tax=Antarctobacter sp. TaxID=1872577 RepID=UPI003A8DF099
MGLLKLDIAGQAMDATNTPVPRAKRYIYAAGTDRLAPVFTDRGLTVQQTNPMTADENGEFGLCFLIDGDYRITIEAEQGQVLFQQDNVIVKSYFALGDGATFRSISQLRADFGLSYTKKSGRIPVAAGDTIMVAEGGHTYSVVGSNVSDPDIVTAGGINLRVVPSLGACDVRAFGAIGDGIADDHAAIQAALNAASRSGGGIVVLPVGTWRITDTLVIPRSTTLQGRSGAGGQRGGGTANHPVTIKYEGTYRAIQMGQDGDNCVNTTLDGFAIIAESTDANFRTFTAFYGYDLRSSQLRNLYVEGADKAYYFTGEGGAFAYVETHNLNAFDCNMGLETECPTPIGDVSPFMQANLFGIRNITNCDTGVRLGGGQQIHSRIDLRAAEIGACGIGIHVDGDDEGKRLTYQVDGQGWLEKNTNGNIVLDSGTIYVSGDITNNDNNVVGGIIQNGGRIIPLGRSSFDDYSIPFTGFTSNGLVRAFSLVDEGNNSFHCPISGARASIVGGGSKASGNTRFGDGVTGNGAGGGLRVYDTSFDWTGDWTLAVMIQTPSTADSVYHYIVKNSGPSFLELSARPGFLRVRTRDSGGAATSDDLGPTGDNPIRSPFWFILSYDSANTEFQLRAPSGKIVHSVVQPMPSGLTSGGYDQWAVNGGALSVQNTVDEIMLYDRVLTADEVMAIFELRTNAVGAIGRDPRQGIARRGTFSGTTDASGVLAIPHGLLDTPNSAFAQIVGNTTSVARVTSITATQIALEVQELSGQPLANTAIDVSWRAEI